MAKNIIVLSDGTGQEGGKGHDTNVYKLMRMLEDRTERQIVFYDRGIGTDTNKITGNLAGAGFSENLLQCYQFIYENYNAGDKIYLFGFSRGAATVRSLANFVHYFGILPKSRPELIKQAYALYRIGREERKNEMPEEEKNFLIEQLIEIAEANPITDVLPRGSSLNERARKFVYEHPNQWASIEFLGVWDTVPALGVPGAVIDTFVNFIPGWKHRYHDFTLHPSVKNAYHALSIDDDRKWFQPTIWNSYNENYQKVEQVWFSGSHTDVGGGFREPGLSDITLEWMVQKAVSHGIKLHLRSMQYWNFCVAPDATDDIHLPRVGAGKVYPEMQRNWSKAAQETFGLPKIHTSVLERAERVRGYKPWILEEFPEHEVELWVENFEYEDGEISIRDYDEENWQEKLEFDGKRIKIKSIEAYYNKLLERGRWHENRLKRDLVRWKKDKK